MAKKEMVTSLEQVMRLALREAEEAVKSKSYGVGGVLVDARTGEVIHTMHNRVIENDHVSDPTAHGERQLVDWYYEQVSSGAELPKPENIIVVTTLDPCYMCTGSILTGGFKAVVGAYDDHAGINWDKSNSFKPLEGETKKQILESFSYPEVTGNSCYAREAFGKTPSIFQENVLSSQTVQACFDVFDKGAAKARDIEKRDSVDPGNAKDPRSLPADDEIIERLREIDSDSLTYTAPEPQKPDIGLAPYLQRACEQDAANGGDGDAVAFLDLFGNLILCLPGLRNISPIRSPYMRTIRAYAKLRNELGDRGRQYLCDPKYGTFLFYKGFDKSARSFADMGAYGSTMPSGLQNSKGLQYILPLISQRELDDYISGMAERYRSILKPMLVEDAELAKFRFRV